MQRLPGYPYFSWSLEEYQDFTHSTVWLEGWSWDNLLPWAKDASWESSDDERSLDFIDQTSVEWCFGVLEDEHWFVGLGLDGGHVVGLGIDDNHVVGLGVDLEESWWCMILSLMIQINTSKKVHFLCRHKKLLIPTGKFSKCAISQLVNNQSIEWQKGDILLHHCLVMQSKITSIPQNFIQSNLISYLGNFVSNC